MMRPWKQENLVFLRQVILGQRDVIHGAHGRQAIAQYRARNELKRAPVKVVRAKDLGHGRKAKSRVAAHQVMKKSRAAAPVSDNDHWRLLEGCPGERPGPKRLY